MFSKHWPVIRPGSSASQLADRIETLELNRQLEDDFSPWQQRREEKRGHPQEEEEDEKSDDDDGYETIDRSAQSELFTGVPVSPDDADASIDEPVDPFEEDWSDVKEIEPILDPTFCVECMYTQSDIERERNPDFVKLQTLRVETRGKMSVLAQCKMLQHDYNVNIRSENPHLADKPVSLENWRDHPTKHVICPDVVEIDSLRFVQEMMTCLQKGGIFMQNKKTKHRNLDASKIKLWITLHNQRKPLLVEHRKRLSD